MSEQKIIELVIFLSVFAFGGGGLIFWLKSVFRKRREEVENRFRRQKIIRQHSFAHFYGRESIGHFQARGNGVLVMTADEIHFLQALSVVAERNIVSIKCLENLTYVASIP